MNASIAASSRVGYAQTRSIFFLSIDAIVDWLRTLLQAEGIVISKVCNNEKFFFWSILSMTRRIVAKQPEILLYTPLASLPYTK